MITITRTLSASLLLMTSFVSFTHAQFKSPNFAKQTARAAAPRTTGQNARSGTYHNKPQNNFNRNATSNTQRTARGNIVVVPNRNGQSKRVGTAPQGSYARRNSNGSQNATANRNGVTYSQRNGNGSSQSAQVNRGGARFNQRGPNNTGQSGYVNRNGAGYNQRGPNGTGQNAYVNRNGAGFNQRGPGGTGQSAYANRNGVGYNQRGPGGTGQSAYANKNGIGYNQRGPNGWGQGAYAGKNGAGYNQRNTYGSQSGFVNRNEIGYNQRNRDGSGQSVYVGKNRAAYSQQGVGGSSQGGFVQGGANAGVGYHNYNPVTGGYGGTIQKQGGGVGVTAQYNQSVPGVPFLQQRNTANVNINGSKSSIGGTQGVYAGGVQLGQQGVTADGRQMNYSARVNGPVRGTGNANMRYGGINTTVRGNAQVGVPGFAKANGNATINRREAKAAVDVNVLGNKQRVSATVNKDTAKRYDPGRAVKGTGLPSRKQVFGF